MSEPFLGQITMFGGNFAPRGWALCQGQILPINQNQSLFSLLGTTYGGDGRTTFGLPDLRGRAAVHPGANVDLGQKSGSQSVSLNANQIPAHTHRVRGTSDQATSNDPTSNVFAAKARFTSSYYADPADGVVDMATSIVGLIGGQAHENMQPFLVVNYIIAIQGLFPSRN